MDVRRRLVGLGACGLMMLLGIPLTAPQTSAAAGTLTIDGQYESAGPLGAGEVRTLVVTGRGGVPASGVGAVALNVTVTNPTDSSFITAWPTGAARPTAANLNFVAGQTVPNMVVVKVGDSGQVSFYNLEGAVDLVVDVMGWFPEGSTYTGLTPARLADSRPDHPTIDGRLAGTGRVGPGATSDIQVVGRGGVPAAGVGAVALNVTAVSPSAPSFLTAWPTGQPRPTSANLNYQAGDIVPNMVIVKVGAGGTVSFFNYAGTTDLVVDVMGWFPDTGSFEGLTPARLLDTRAGYPTFDTQSSGEGAVGANAVRELTVVGRGGVPATGVGAVVVNVAVTNPTESSFLTVYPSGSARPLAANLNFVPRQTVPNMVIAKVGEGGRISIYNLKGTVDVVVDVMGWFPEGVAYAGLVPARLMDTRPGGTPTTRTLPGGGTSPGGGTLPGGGTPPPVTTTPPVTTVTPPPPAPWTQQSVDMPLQPRADTPVITDGEIFDLDVNGTSVFALGSFSTAVNASANGGTTFAQPQPQLVKYDIDTGALDLAFDPRFDNAITDMALSPDGQFLYVVGLFRNAAGNAGDATQAAQRVVKLRTSDGTIVGGFASPTFDARATAVVADAGRVYVGGRFTTAGGVAHSGLAALDATTGAIVSAWDPQLAGGIGVGGLLTVQRLMLSNDGTKLIVIHTARRMDGLDRYGVGMLDPGSGDVLPWRTTLFQDNLGAVGGVIRVYAGDVAPDDSYFVVTSASGGDRPPISDVALRFPMAGGDGVQPTWVTRQFDSIYSVAIREGEVFVGGHFSWAESPRSAQPWPGLTNQGYGTGQGIGAYALGDQVVRRSQLAALDATNGIAREWNPGANAFEGVKALAATARGLFVGFDGTTTGGRNTQNLAFYDRTTLAPQSTSGWLVSPYDGVVVPSGQVTTLEGQAASGSAITGIDVRIQRVDAPSTYLCADGRYDATCASIPATVIGSGTSVSWTLAVAFPTAPREFHVRVRVRYGAGQQTSFNTNQSFLETYLFDDASPATTITAPVSGVVNANTFTITGEATDDHGISAVTFYFRNLDTGYYLQDDGTAGPAYNAIAGIVDTPGAPTSTWQATVTVPTGSWEFGASAVDNVGQPDLRAAEREWVIDPTAVSPTLSVTSPVVWNPPVAPATSTPSTPYGPIAPGTAVTFAGNYSDDQAVAGIYVALRNATTQEALSADGQWGTTVSAGLYRFATPGNASGTWSWSPQSLGISLTPGVYTFRVYGLDDQGLATTSANTPSVTMTVQVSGNAFPDTSIGAGPSGANPDQSLQVAHLDLSGTASDAEGALAGVRVVVNDLDTGLYLTAPDGPMSASYSYIDIPLSGGSPAVPWSLSTDLPGQGEYSVTAIAYDAAGQLDTSTAGATWRYLIYPGDQDPTLSEGVAVSPAQGATLPAGQPIFVDGRALDDHGISGVRITIQRHDGMFITSTGVSATSTNLSAFLTSPGSMGSNFNYTTPSAVSAQLTAGTYTIGITPVDNWGQFPLTPSATISITLA